jgi:predicted Fe-S protein YdhL (DUF1289 family)
MDNIPRRVQSPCIRNCCLNDEDVCLGCFRRIEEIVRWSEADDSERRLILQNAKERETYYGSKVNVQSGFAPLATLSPLAGEGEGEGHGEGDSLKI